LPDDESVKKNDKFIDGFAENFVTDSCFVPCVSAMLDYRVFASSRGGGGGGGGGGGTQTQLIVNVWTTRFKIYY